MHKARVTNTAGRTTGAFLYARLKGNQPSQLRTLRNLIFFLISKRALSHRLTQLRNIILLVLVIVMYSLNLIVIVSHRTIHIASTTLQHNKLGQINILPSHNHTKTRHIYTITSQTQFKIISLDPHDSLFLSYLGVGQMPGRHNATQTVSLSALTVIMIFDYG